MKVADKVIIVTGGASGIGKALVERFHREGAKALIVADMNGDGAEAVAKSVGGIAVQADVAREADVQTIARTAEERFGRIDLFCSNAGISRGDPEIDNAASAPNAHWELRGASM